jgi:hypothetical protein
MYLESEEGIVPRKKIRLRNYVTDGFTHSPSNLETKISSVEGRYKLSKKIDKLESERLISNGMIIPTYGLILPSAFVAYKRKYLALKQLTITIDSEIRYKMRSEARFEYREELCVLEVKGENDKEIQSDLLSLGLNSSMRFSKYCQAVRGIS